MKLTVIDVTTDTVLLDKGTYEQASKVIDSTVRNIGIALSQGRLIKKKYRVIPHYAEKNTEKRPSYWTERMCEIWDKTMRGIRRKYHLDMTKWNEYDKRVLEG